MDKKAIKAKRRARRLAMQALYQWLMSGTNVPEIEAQFRAANNMDVVDVEYFCRVLHAVPASVQALDAAFVSYLDRSVDSLNPVELTVIRLGVFELLHSPEIPYRVVLDEAILLAKEFGSQDGHRYVNGVLNQVGRVARAVEINLE